MLPSCDRAQHAFRKQTGRFALSLQELHEALERYGVQMVQGLTSLQIGAQDEGFSASVCYQGLDGTLQILHVSDDSRLW